MRPIDKGENAKQYTSYQEAKRDLVAAIGSYCSYCERSIEHQGTIEHVLPKSIYPNLECDWSNLLLACVNCNSTKGVKDVGLTLCAWPHRDDTFHGIEYNTITRIPIPAKGLNVDETSKMKCLIELVGLDRPEAKVGVVNYERMTDTRCEKRLACAKSAEDKKEKYLASSGKPALLEIIVEMAQLSGFWSVWMHVFDDLPEVREALINAFPGTAKQYFE